MISEVVDPEVQSAALFFFFRDKQPSLGEGDIKLLPAFRLVFPFKFVGLLFDASDAPW